MDADIFDRTLDAESGSESVLCRVRGKRRYSHDAIGDSRLCFFFVCHFRRSILPLEASRTSHLYDAQETYQISLR